MTKTDRRPKTEDRRPINALSSLASLVRKRQANACLLRVFSLWSIVFSPKRFTGFTLVELLAAVVIMSSGLLLVIEGMARSQTGMRVAENLILSSQIAEEAMTDSELSAYQFDQVPRGDNQGSETSPGKVFHWHKYVDAYVHSTIEDETKLNQITVRVDWKEAGNPKDLTLSSLLLNREKKLET